jgi:hypothetical protein
MDLFFFDSEQTCVGLLVGLPAGRFLAGFQTFYLHPHWDGLLICMPSTIKYVSSPPARRSVAALFNAVINSG